MEDKIIKITLCSDTNSSSFTRLHYHLEKTVRKRFISNLFFEKHLRNHEWHVEKILNTVCVFLSVSQVFFPLFYCAEFRNHKVAEYRSNLDPDPQHCLTALLVVVVRTTIVVVICNSCSWEAANCLRSLPW